MTKTGINRLKGKDGFQLVVEIRLSEDQIFSLGFLYPVLISGNALRLFMYLYAKGTKASVSGKHTQLLEGLNFTIDELEKARIELERAGLLEVYMHQEGVEIDYLYQLVAPKRADEFLSNEAYSRIFSKVAGKDNYAEVYRGMNKPFLDHSEYLDITQKFDPSVLSNWNENDQTDYESIKSPGSLPDDYKPQNVFDYAKFFRHYGNNAELALPSRLRTKENLDFIGNTGSLFSIDPDLMAEIVATNLIKDPQNHYCDLNRSKIFYRCENTVSVYHAPGLGNGYYDKAPIVYLRSKQNGVDKIADADAKLLSSLMLDYKLSFPVINVLIDYALESSHNQLKANVVNKVAASWVREGVKTAEEALKLISRMPAQKNSFVNVSETKADESKEKKAEDKLGLEGKSLEELSEILKEITK